MFSHVFIPTSGLPRETCLKKLDAKAVLPTAVFVYLTIISLTSSLLGREGAGAGGSRTCFGGALGLDGSMNTTVTQHEKASIDTRAKESWGPKWIPHLLGSLGCLL